MLRRPVPAEKRSLTGQLSPRRGKAASASAQHVRQGMPINLNAPQLKELKPRIVVCGVGGAGGNAINNMIASGLPGSTSSSPTLTRRLSPRRAPNELSRWAFS